MFRTFISFIQALLAFIEFAFIAVVIYSDFEAPFNFIAGIGVLVFALFASRSIFNMMRRRGVLEVMAGNNSSYELDELDPSPGSGVQKLSAQELTEFFKQGKLKFGVSTKIMIWGDSNDRKLDDKKFFHQIDYDPATDVLRIVFSSHCQLEIEKPNGIYIASSYLKIIKAKAAHWQISVGPNVRNRFSYLNTGKKIDTTSNTLWKPHKYDFGIGMNALY